MTQQDCDFVAQSIRGFNDNYDLEDEIYKGLVESFIWDFNVQYGDDFDGKRFREVCYRNE